MDCSEVEELLSGYVDDCIEDEEKRLVEDHISQCDSCKKEYELLKTIIENSRKLKEIDLPYNFDDELRKKLINEKHSKKSAYKSFIYRYRTAAACLLALTLSLGMLKVLGILSPISPKKSESSSYNTAAGKADINGGNQEKSGETPSLRAYTAADTMEAKETEAAKDAAYGKGENNNPTEPAAASTPKMAMTNGGNDAVGTAEGQPQSDGKIMLSAAVPEEPSYNLIDVALNADEYKAYMDKIDALIQSMNGSVKNREPLQYILLKESEDEFISKLNNEFKIKNVKVTSISLAEEYGALLNEVSDIKSKIENTKDTTSSDSLKIQFSEKESKIKEIDDLSKEIIIQINKQ